MARKNANDYQREYVDAQSKVEALEARIKARAITLCKKFPSAPIGMGAIGREVFKFGYLSTSSYIMIIKSIEDYNASTAPHVQTTLYPKDQK